MCEHKDDFSHMVGLILPDDIDTAREKRIVDVDLCCAKLLQHLWNNRVQTLSHCCGHGKQKPSIVVADYYSPESVGHIKKLISQVDSREWTIFQWKLTEV